MFKNYKRMSLMALAVALVSVSCQKESEVEEIMISQPVKSFNTIKTSTAFEQEFNKELMKIEALPATSHNLREEVLGNAVEPSVCAPTEFSAVYRTYMRPLAKDLVSMFGTEETAEFYFDLYLNLNFYYSYFDTSTQYFGENGEFTDFMAKRKKDLERFWDMPNEIRLNGQHSATLDDREKLADLYELVGLNVETREDAYAIADQLLYINSFSEHLPESPIFAMDGFATTSNLIVVGDGIVQILAETGIDEGIVWTGILSHEWAHQVQFNNTHWTTVGDEENVTEATRFSELEADFLSAYYMSHKRGATYNWKRVEQFYELFFQLGDCGFESKGHHGTPLQRMNAAQLGYALASKAQVQGEILSQEELHQYFTNHIDEIL